ncbi:sporulation protein YpjB [Lentibacillus daqui]|uniref:sporulation protein YpjB n=1 Tax=Lentibacillus daqui TaxID=2911514 RepID=UPI003F6EA6CE
MYIPDNTNALPLHTNPAVRATNDMSLFYWFVAIIGGLIAITLTYVSYRKYKGEQKKREKDKEQNS